MERGRCGPLVEARNAPGLAPEGCSGCQTVAVGLERVSPDMSLLKG